LIVLLEITRGHFDKEIKPFIAPADVKELANGSKYYRFRAVVDLFVERATKRNGTSRGKDSDPIIDRLKIEQLEQRNRIEALRIEDIEQKRRLENGNLLQLQSPNFPPSPCSASVHALWVSVLSVVADVRTTKRLRPNSSGRAKKKTSTRATIMVVRFSLV